MTPDKPETQITHQTGEKNYDWTIMAEEGRLDELHEIMRGLPDSYVEFYDDPGGSYYSGFEVYTGSGSCSYGFSDCESSQFSGDLIQVGEQDIFPEELREDAIHVPEEYAKDYLAAVIFALGGGGEVEIRMLLSNQEVLPIEAIDPWDNPLEVGSNIQPEVEAYIETAYDIAKGTNASAI